jgi:hypothetical protein
VKVRAQANNFQPPQIVEDLRSVVIYDDFNNPIIVVQKLNQNNIITYRAGDPQFDKAMKTLGIGLNAKVKVAG